jgi:hypothetical protein
MTNKLVTIDFAGGTMEAALGPDGQPFVNVRRVCEELGINTDTQARKLKSSLWATTVIMTVVASDGKEREMLFVNARAVPMWAATINASKIASELRPKLVAYQIEAADVLARYFMGPGPALVPATGGDNLTRLASIQDMAVAALKIGEQLSRVAVDHEQRLRCLEAKPAVTIKVTNVSEVRRVRTRWNSRLREEVYSLTEHMSQEEKSEFFSMLNGGLKRAFGERDNWTVDKFYEGARWLLRNYAIDITDIEEP